MALYAMSSFVRLMSTVAAAEGDGETVAPGAVQPVTSTAMAARSERPRINERIGGSVGAGSVGGGRHLRRVLRLPLRGRGAEALVVDVLGDRRLFAADRAARIATQPHLAERGLERDRKSTRLNSSHITI